MYCKNCGKEIEEGSRFCPHCGAENASATGESSKPAAPVNKKEQKKKKPLIIAIVAVVILLVLGIAVFSDGDSSRGEGEQLITMVQNGYLGNYDTVTIKEVLEYMDEDAEWNAGEAASGGYIVEWKEDDIIIQFSIDRLEGESFRVTWVEAAGIEASSAEAYDVKLYLDGIYQLYANAYPEKGLFIDTSTSNDTLVGHIGPVRETKDFTNAPAIESTMKDLAEYGDYTEDELVQELGYEKNEYGIYPNEEHINFLLSTDGGIYAIQLNKPEDVEMSLCGVKLQDTVEEADAVLKEKGFICEESRTVPDALNQTGVLDIMYVENETGYSYCIRADAKRNITSLIYVLEKEESIYEEAETEEENQVPVTEPLTYGTYVCDDGAGTISTAEVGFYTDEEEGDYIYIQCREDDQDAGFFRGTLVENGESYYACREAGNTEISVIFADGGMYVQVENAEFAEDYSIEGFYSLMEALNLDEAG